MHYLSDLVRLLASKWIEQDDAICSVSWCSEFRRAVGGQSMSLERGLDSSLSGWRRRVLSLVLAMCSVAENTGAREGRRHSLEAAVTTCSIPAQENMCELGVAEVTNGEQAGPGLVYRIGLCLGELT